MPKRTKSSAAWLQEHEADPYVQKARQLGYRSRAVFKLLEIDQKDKLLKSGLTIVDLGAAPGGWSELAAKKVSVKGRVIAMDILPMQAIAGVDFLQGDFNDEEIVQQLLTLVNGKVDLVLCDIAPNMSGNATVDQMQSMQLAEAALEFSRQVLVKNGNFLVKVFQGAGFQEYLALLRKCFKQVVTRKPDASRARSTEVYLLGKFFL